MSELRKANTDHPYFVTMTIVGWIDIFTRKEYCNIITKSLEFCRKNKGLKIYEYAIMPSHVHLILQSLDCKLFSIVRDFKSFTAKEIIKTIEKSGFESRKEWLLHMFQYHAMFKKQNINYMLWQKTNYPVELNTSYIFEQKREYIRNNPIESGLVTDSGSWYYSSACPISPLKMDNS